MEDLKNIHSGERVFIMGNGPSINGQDLSLLKNEQLMVSNQFFLNPRIDWTPPYYFSTDRKGTGNNLDRILENTKGMTRFFEAIWRKKIQGPSDYFLTIRRERENPSFTLDLSAETLRSGYCITYIQLQLAVWMGFREIYLIGVDHSKGHFVPEKEYHNGKGHFDLMLPVVEKFLGEAGRVCSGIGVHIYNATAGGNLEVFERRNYESLF